MIRSLFLRDQLAHVFDLLLLLLFLLVFLLFFIVLLHLDHFPLHSTLVLLHELLDYTLCLRFTQVHDLKYSVFFCFLDVLKNGIQESIFGVVVGEHNLDDLLLVGLFETF